MSNKQLLPPFEAYKGQEPYIFISYSHKDSIFVFPEIKRLSDLGYRIWYDEGIDPGNEWPEEIAKALNLCSFFVVFISSNAVNSQNVRNEINFALNKSKPFLAVHIEDISLPEGLELRMGDIQAILKYRMIDTMYDRKIDKVLPVNLRELQYFYKIGPHPLLPFWKEFREEIRKFAHSNSTHVNLLGELGEFNEFFKNKDYKNALNSIDFFLTMCNKLIPGYGLIFPWIVKAVTQQELNLHTEAALSYQEALKSDKNNPTALGGVGMAYLFAGFYNEAAGYFNDAVKNSTGIQKINERLYLVMAMVSAGKPLDPAEKEFVRNLNIEETHQLEIEEMDRKELLPAKDDKLAKAILERKELIQKRYDEQRGFILYAKALSYFVEAEALRLKISQTEYNSIMVEAYNILKFEVPEEKLNKADKIFYLYMAASYLGYKNPEKILLDAIERSKNDYRPDTRKLYGYLAEHYTSVSDYSGSIDIYEKWIVNNNPDNRELLHYAFNLKNSGNSKYKAICKDVLYQLPENRKVYYWSGYANYLLGREEIAKEDYERSGSFDIYYDQY